jgi:hypothetical protein
MNISQLSKCTVQTALRIEQIRLQYALSESDKETIKKSIKELAQDLLVRYKKEIDANP